MHPLAMVRAAFPADRMSVAQARRFVRDALHGWGLGEVADDAVLLTSELVTNAVLHAGTPFEVMCRLADTAVQVEVVDGEPERTLPVPEQNANLASTTGRGLTMPLKLAGAWGVTYDGDTKTVWFRLDVGGGAGHHRRVTTADPDVPAPLPAVDRVHPADLERADGSWLSFLAEASDLLAGTLEENMLIALAAQLVVPRLALWCAFYAADGAGDMRLTYVWHADEKHIDALRALLGTAPAPDDAGGVGDWPGLAALPADSLAEFGAGRLVKVPLRARGRGLGVLVLGRPEGSPFPQDVMWLAEDLGRRIAIGLDNARMYSRQQATSTALQRSLLPPGLPEIPGIEHCVIYEPVREGNEVGGDFYDVFTVGPRRWRFAIGDVCGAGPEAAAVTGLARHALRLLARDGHGIADVLERLNQAIIDEGARARLITVLHGELFLNPGGGARLTLVSAGHPLPLRLSADGVVTVVARPQLLLGALENTEFAEETVDLDPGDVLLCVTDGVTERRNGDRMLDDEDGLARILADCGGLSAGAVANRLRQAIGAFGSGPLADDVALLVLRVL